MPVLEYRCTPSRGFGTVRTWLSSQPHGPPPAPRTRGAAVAARDEETVLPAEEPNRAHDERADLLRVSVDVHPDGATVVSVTGEVDLYTSGLLHDALAQVLTGEPKLIVVDLTKVGFLSSSGLSELVELLRATAPRAIVVRLVGDSRAVTRPLQAAGLEDLFDWSDTVADALQKRV